MGIDDSPGCGPIRNRRRGRRLRRPRDRSLDAFLAAYGKKPGSGWEGVRTEAGDMWKPDAPWEKVSHAVSVIQLAPPNVESAREPDLKQALDDIKRRHLALALEASPCPQRPAPIQH
jgi:hypothetical protein